MASRPRLKRYSSSKTQEACAPPLLAGESELKKRSTIVLLGRPNVGKSTLFNKLARSQRAITHNYAGTTRDYKMAEAKLGDIEFKVIDTAGLCLGKGLSALEKAINAQTEAALSKADIIFFVVDGKAGLTPGDRDIARFLRKKDLKTPLMLIINKCDHKIVEQNQHDFFELSYENACQISAEHSIGLDNLYHYLQAYLTASDSSELPAESTEYKIKIAVIGRPNVGKSTMINALKKEDRVVTGHEPGTTRDAISVDLAYKSNAIELIDTAGMRKKSKIDRGGLEKLSVNKTIEAIESADIVLLVVDSNTLLESQDLKIANIAIELGKPLILVVNKIDTITGKNGLQSIQEEIKYLTQIKLVAVKTLYVVYISAIKNKNVSHILDKAIEVYALWSKKIPTSQLNEWLARMVEAHQPPLTKSGRRIKLKYITQVKSRPPIFKMFSNKPEEIPPHYLQYLTNKLEQDFGFNGVPLKIIKAQSNNPYSSDVRS